MVTNQSQLNKNIEIVSIVDKFLEHSRILIFCNNEVEKYYITSADWMTRNLDHRIEVAVPIYSKSIQHELKTIVEYEWDDNVKARIVDGKGKNEFKTNAEEPFRSQEKLMEHYRELEKED